MKVTKEQLQKIIKEELEEMVKEEGEMDEALGGFLKGAVKTLGTDVSDKTSGVKQWARGQLDKATAYKDKLVRSGEIQSMKDELVKINTQLQTLTTARTELMDKLKKLGVKQLEE